MVGEQLGEAWHQMIDSLARSKAEIMVRAVRDILADCLSTLPELLARQNTASLHFYFANFTGMRRHLFPEAIAAYQRWITEQNPEVLQTLANEGRLRWLAMARAMLDIHVEKGADAGPAIENLLEPAPDTTPCCNAKTASKP